MEPAPIAPWIDNRIEVIVRTSHSVIYADRDDPDIVIKSETIWIEGEPYDAPTKAAQTDADLTREFDIYEALETHPNVPRCHGLIRDANDFAIALKLDRLPCGDLRSFIEESPPPRLQQRLSMAIDFTAAVHNLHSRGVVWGDLSTRNTLFSVSTPLTLCDFASSVLPPKYTELGVHTYELICSHALPREQVERLPLMQREIYALGSAIYEIMEWKKPYEEISADELSDVIEGGILPIFHENNIAANVIRRCWVFKYTTADDVLSALEDI